MGLWEDLDAESAKPGPTMTITKAQYSALRDEAYYKHAAETLDPMVRDSKIVLTIYGGSLDPKLAIETGYGVLLDKPFIFLVKRGTEVPVNLTRLARRIIFYEDVNDPAVQSEIGAAIESISAEEPARG